MSYYPPHTHATTQPTTSATTYPYAGYSQPGTYQSTGYPTAQYQPYGTGYGAWPYPYSYYPQQQQQGPLSAPKPAPTATTVPTVAPVSAPIAAPPLSSRAPSTSTYTFSSYNRDPNLYGRNSKKGSSYRGLFTKELRSLMYGFGDDRNPATDTVNVMEEILIEYIVDICQTASGGGKKSRLSVEDIRRVLSRTPDAKKLARMEELLFMQEDIKRARSQFNEADMHPDASGM